ncbi:recombinase family protein [Pseudomonas atacamensis]|uniref:recombinase family protein n=1 Tax=Pseudomonas atacamensis TaxID=2565368 RepID=UPI003C957F5B
MKRAVSYTRFSSHRQHGGTSLERQEVMIANWLEQHPEYTVAETTYSDLAKSGYHGEHAAKGGSFGKLLDAVEAGKITAGDVILVEAIDRTGRLPALQMLTEIIGPILRAGISIWTLDDGAEYTTESLNGGLAYLLVSRIQAAHGYSKTLSRRVTASYDKRREQARDGKRIKRWTPVWLTTDGEVIDRIAMHIKTAFELYVAGVGKASIAVRMRATGQPELAKASGPGVEGWLRNKTAIGYWNDIPGAYAPIIDQDLFFRAQQRGKEAKTTRPVKTAKHFLVGLVVCGHCGANYIMQNKDGRPHSMRCRTRQAYKAAGCSNSKIIPKPVLDFIRLRTSFAAIQTAFQRQQLTTNQKRILELEGQVEAVTKKISDLALAIQTVGAIPEVISQLETRKKERDALHAELLVLERTESPVDAMGAVMIEHDLLESDPVKLNALLRGVDYRITVYSDGRMLVNSPEETTPWIYDGADGHRGLYRVKHDGNVIDIPKPTSDELEKLQFLKVRVNFDLPARNLQ